MQLTQPIKWHGGKHYLAKKITALMPPHVHYVEPYFGGGSVLLQKDPNGVSEVVNDIDQQLTNFWQVLQREDLFGAFLRRASTIPFSQTEWDTARAVCNWPEMEAAVRFFVRARQSRQGLMKDFATLSRNRTRRGMNEQVSSWLTAIEGLPEVHERLKRVVILNDDALKVIKSQDGPNTLFYLDPPYLHETRVTTNDYAHEMTQQQHVELLGLLAGIGGKFLLSGYHSRVYDDFALNCAWRCEEIQIPNNASSAKVKQIKTECVWMNYQEAKR